MKKISQLYEKQRQIDYFKDRLLNLSAYLSIHAEKLIVNQEMLNALELCVNEMEGIVEKYKKIVENLEKVVKCARKETPQVLNTQPSQK